MMLHIFFLGLCGGQQPDKPELVECSVQECPGFLHRSFMELFPDVGLKTGQLTVVSISQHTNNDMSSWSPDVEEERDTLMANVSTLSIQILG